MFANLEAFLARKVAEAASPDILRELGRELSVSIDANVMETGGDVTGVMRRNVTFVGQPEPVPGGYQIGVGRGGREHDSAPSATIAQFINDHPEYQGGWPRGKMAWHGLGRDSESRRAAQEDLAMAREAGAYGGVVGESPYYYIQEKGNAEVGITGRHFIENAIQDFESRVDNIMLRLFVHA